MKTVTRKRVLEWQDPKTGASAMGRMSGLQYMSAMISGDVPPPPMAVTMNMVLTEVAEGSATFTAEPDESHYNPLGAVHGGFACTVLDSAAGCAVHTTLERGYAYTSLEIKVSYLKALSNTSGPLTAIGRVVKPGRRVAFAEAELRNADGVLLATASSTILVFPLET